MINKTVLSVLFLIASMLFSCNKKTSEVATIDLTANWQFRKVGDTTWLPATVPGCVHTDLLANKKIEDFFYRDNEKKVQWIEKEDWEYKSEFEVSAETLAKKNIELNFKGLDTYADVFVNDSLVIKADNMFIEWSALIKPYLKVGTNSLRVYFHSAVNEGMKKLQQLPYNLIAANEQAPDNAKTNVFTRKAPFHYGWDWGPRLVTSGIWRPVYLKTWDNATLTDAFFKLDNLTDNKAEYTVACEIMASTEDLCSIEVNIDGQTFKKEGLLAKGLNVISVPVSIENPKLWWSNGLGDPNLYPAKVTLSVNGSVAEQIEKQIGVRTVKVITEPDSIGKSFYVELNGKPVFMKGANYIPSHTLTTAVTPEVYARVIADAKDANMNMLRVWGGGIYENDLLYDLCDQNGILIWHDFMFACAMMPGDSSHLDNIRKEAEYNVKRLRNHPCIALWCGNNENLIAWQTWGWKEKFSKEVADYNWNVYQKIFCEILPNAVQKNDPGKFYWESSAQSAKNELPNTKSGDIHDWGIWFGQQKYEDFDANTGRFMSEYGMQSLPEMATIKTFADQPEDFQYRSDLIQYRQRSKMDFIKPGMNGNDMIRQYMDYYYKVPEKFDDYVYVSQLSQGEGFKAAIEAHRRHMPVCMGSLYWQINDCWPTVSWASVDYYGNWKAAHYMIRDAYKPVIISPVLKKDHLYVHVVSDLVDTIANVIKLSVIDFNGNVVWTESRPGKTKPGMSRLIFDAKISNITMGKPLNSLVFIASIFDEDKELIDQNLLYFTPFKQLNLPKPDLKYSITTSGKRTMVELSSATLVKNVFLATDSLKGRFSENYFDMLPNEIYKVYFDGPANELEKQLRVKSLADVN